MPLARLFRRPPAPLTSAVCTERQLRSPTFRRWAAAIGEPVRLHRKLWEWCYIAQALDERGMLRPGRRGLGFAVGTEPLAALFAARGCEVLATDLDPAFADGWQARWMATGQHAASRAVLNARGVCPADAFDARVTLRYVDMNRVPDDLTGFDFVWSSCAFEHLGSLAHGKRFVDRMTRCLRPGGVAVHTTDFNVESDDETVEVGPNVLFRRRDVEEMARRVAGLGCRMADRDYSAGGTFDDWLVDLPPYRAQTHLKLECDGYVVTSIGLVIEKDG